MGKNATTEASNNCMLSARLKNNDTHEVDSGRALVNVHGFRLGNNL